MKNNEGALKAFQEHCELLADLISEVDDRGLREALRQGIKQLMDGAALKGWSNFQIHWIESYEIPDTIEGLFEAPPNA